MMHVKSLLVLAVLVLGVVASPAQFNLISNDKAAALDQAADQFVARLHQSLDVAAAKDMFVADLAELHRDYPGDFMPFDTPRLSKALLKQVDDVTLRRKLLADYNLHYWTSVQLLANPAANADPAKALPPEFLKAAKKSTYLRNFAGIGGSVTLNTPQEMTEFLAEADQLGALLKKGVRQDMLTSEAFRAASDKARTAFGGPRVVRDAMGIDTAYTLARDSMMLVMIEKDGQYKLIALAPLSK